MAQITIDIPDDLAERLAPFQSQFSNLFTRSISTLLPETMIVGLSSPMETTTYQEILDFLVSRPTSEQIINFKVSAAAQSRLQTLLQKNREAALTATETAEIDLYQQLDTLIGFLKIRALTALRATPQT
jgi:hypothetical protein